MKDSSETSVNSQGYRGTAQRGCAYCSMRFYAPNQLRGHQRLHTNEKPYSCKHCSKQFNHKWNLDIHSRSHIGDTMYKCLNCVKSYTNSNALRNHRQKKHNELWRKSQDQIDMKQYKCRYCHRGFNQRRFIWIHERIHLGSTLYTCQYCDNVQFMHKTNTIRHEQIHFGIANQAMRHECDYCGKVFVQATNKNRHEIGIHLK